MKYEYTHFIPENVAPKGATRIVVNRKISETEEVEVCSIPSSRFGSLTTPEGKPLYSFGLVSDTHMGYNSYTNKSDPSTVGTSFENGQGYGEPPNGTNLRYALDYMVGQDCSFVVNCGDLTNIGFYFASGDTELYPYQFQEYRDIFALYPNLTVYNVMGNHESYNSNIVNNLDELEEYTGTREIAYYFEQEFKQGSDVFIIVGQSSNTLPMTDAHLEWLEDSLKRFKDKRCFVFVHSFLIDDSGAACNARGNSIFGMTDYWKNTQTPKFKQIMAQYPNAVLFHGHSHMKLESQAFDKNANYTEKNGFKSIHIPSLGDPRTLTTSAGAWVEDKYGGQYYIVDVYSDAIVLRGMYVHRPDRTIKVIKTEPVSLGTYKIEV